MAVTVWKGHLTFGLVSVPIRLVRAARREKVSFHHLYRPQRESRPPEESVAADEEQEATREVSEPDELAPVTRIRQGAFTREGESAPIPASQIVKGYEYEKNRYVTIEKDELEQIAPKTTTGMEIVEFVKLAEIDPIYFDASYYVIPDGAGEKPYTLLLDALRESGYVALAEFTMRRRQHAVVIRPGATGMIAHTIYYADEIRKLDEFRADASGVTKKERDLALTLIKAMSTTFEPEKFKDAYKEKLRELIAAKVAGQQIVMEAQPEVAPVVDIMEALQKSLDLRRKPMASAPAAAKPTKRARAK